MEAEKVRTMPTIPDDLVERILALVPFPFILKARALSKSWRARLSPVSPYENVEEEKSDNVDEMTRLAISFQRRMGQYWTAKWATFGPLFVSKEDLVGYDRASDRWQRLPSLSFLPDDHNTKSERTYLQVKGGLLFTSFWCSGPPNALSVANVLTRSWKQLPPHPLMEGVHTGPLQETVVTDMETYKVIEFYANDILEAVRSALIYDSKVDAWIRTKVEVPSPDFTILCQGVCLDGLIYWLLGTLDMSRAMPRGVLAFNGEEDSFQVLQLPAPDLPHISELAYFFYLMVCHGSLLMAFFDQHWPPVELVVWRIDLELRRWVEVTRGPSAAASYSLRRTRPASDGRSIFLVGEKLGGNEEIVAYNVQNDEWSSLPLPAMVTDAQHKMKKKYRLDTSSFQPGLNPFRHI